MKALAALLVSFFCVTGVLAQQANPPKKEPQKKVKVTKPCKDGQTEADGCHVVKKVEKKAEKAKPKPPPKKQENKK